MTGESRIVVFQEKVIRRAWYGGEWLFSVIDVVGVLSESNHPKRYWSDLKRKLALEAGSGQPYEKIVRLKLTAPDGKQRDTDCANTETLFRIIQSVPSPRAEPFKRWLAQVGYERIKEIEDPELASTRARDLYEAKGYPKDWIEKRMQVKTGNNLRDHMTDLELIFTMLGEASTTEIARRKDAQGLNENQNAAKAGGAIAGNARKELENKTGTPVVSRQNYLTPPEATFAEIAATAFIETQTEALAPAPADKAKTRKRVAAKVEETVADLRGTKKGRRKQT